MPHHVTNRRRYYSHQEADTATSFTAEAMNASAYVAGGAAFTAGSAFFLPALKGLQPLGAWLFIAGSGLYVLVSLHDLWEVSRYMRKSRESSGRRRLELGNSSLYFAGSVVFLVGSVYFLPYLKAEAIGGWCFIAGSVLFILGAAINVGLITQAASLLMLQLFNVIAILFIVGSTLFIVSSIPYLWQAVGSPDRQPLHTYAAGQFIAASTLFLAGGLLNFYRAYEAHQRHRQPLGKKSGCPS